MKTMIDKEDLRIGNIISHVDSDDSFYAKVKSLNINRCYYGGVMSSYEHLRPIPITEDWLLKMGFEKKEPTKWHGNGYDYQPPDVWTEQLDFVLPVIEDYDFIFRFEKWKHTGGLDEYTVVLYCNWHPKCNESLPASVVYVHSLQNLVYAICRKELKIQES